MDKSWPHFALRACLYLEEARSSLHLALQIPMRGYPSAIRVEMRRRIREARSILQGQGISDDLLSRFDAAYCGFCSQKGFESRVYDEGSSQREHESSQDAADTLDVAMGSIKQALPFLEEIWFSCGWALARFGFFSRLMVDTPRIFARNGQLNQQWEEIGANHLATVATATAGFLATTSVRLASRWNAPGSPPLDVIEQLVELSRVESPISKQTAQQIRKIVHTVLDSLDESSMTDWLFDALEERFLGPPTTAPPGFRQDAEEEARAEASLKEADHRVQAAERSGDLELLDEAIQMIDEMLRSCRRPSPRLTTLLNRKAGFYWQRYMMKGRIADLDRSIHFIQQVLRETPTFSADAEGLLNNLGLALLTRFEQIRDPTSIEDAVDALEEVTATHDDPTGRQVLWWNNHANALRQRFHFVSHDLRDLEDSARRLEVVVSQTPPGHPDAGIHYQNLANVRRELAQLVAEAGGQDEIGASIDMLRGVLDTGLAAEDRPALHSSLAASLRQRYEKTGDAADRDASIHHYRLALSEGSDLRPQIAMQAGIHWGDWAFERQAWAETVEAFEGVHGVSERMFHVQVGRTHRESVLKWTQGTAPSAAYSLVMLGMPEKAAVLLESSLGRLLSRSLETGRRDLERLRDDGHQVLYERYRAAAENLARGDDEAGAPPGLSLAKRQAAMDATLEEIRQIPGFESFLRQLSWQEILATSSNDPIVYVFATAHGGMALALERSATVVMLPELTIKRATAMVLAHMKGLRADAQHMQAAVEDSVKASWTTIIDPLLRQIKLDRVHLVAVGRLQLLPLHAAAAVCATGWKRKVCFSYAPNVRSLLRTERHVVRQELTLMVKMSDYHRLPPLPYTNLERDLVQRIVGAIDVLEDAEATPSAVLAALGEHEVAHFSCHGSANPLRPLDSALYVAGDAAVTVADILALSQLRTRFVILSACKTAIAGVDLPDEVVNFPTSLLATGAAGIVSTLWAVQDEASALFIARFYFEWKRRGSPHAAFFEAQRWLSTATATELIEFLESLGPWSPDSAVGAALEDLRGLSPTYVPHAHPSVWAPFCWVGVTL